MNLVDICAGLGDSWGGLFFKPRLLPHVWGLDPLVAPGGKMRLAASCARLMAA